MDSRRCGAFHGNLKKEFLLIYFFLPLAAYDPGRTACKVRAFLLSVVEPVVQPQPAARCKLTFLERERERESHS